MRPADTWTLDASRLNESSPPLPVRRMVAFETELPWMLTVALARGLELTVGPLRVRAGRGCVIATRDGGTFVAEAFPDEVADALLGMPWTSYGPARYVELYRAVREAAPDLIPVGPTQAELWALRRAIDVASDLGDAKGAALAAEALADAKSYGRRAVLIADMLADLDRADAVADTEPAPVTVRVSSRPPSS